MPKGIGPRATSAVTDGSTEKGFHQPGHIRGVGGRGEGWAEWASYR